MKIKNTQLEIMQGNISDLNVDRIIDPSNKSLDKGFGINEHIVRAACLDGLLSANKDGCKTIAIAPIGCEDDVFNAIGSAKIISQEILKHCKFEKTSLDKIIVCLPHEELFNIFYQTISGYITHIQDTLGDGPYVTTDIIIELPEGIVIIERSNPPYGYALPGGFLDYGESLEDAAVREAKEETNLDLENLRQFHTYSKLGRDPRFQTVTTVFIATGKGVPMFGDDAKGLKVVSYSDLMDLDYAFDHKDIIKKYLSLRK